MPVDTSAKLSGLSTRKGQVIWAIRIALVLLFTVSYFAVPAPSSIFWHFAWSLVNMGFKIASAFLPMFVAVYFFRKRFSEKIGYSVEGLRFWSLQIIFIGLIPVVGTTLFMGIAALVNLR
ncbi:hypothetical protein ABVF61_02365 [Roseibium sp. HPY-6]|uniref:hypothetical protein n=1 Tax=Roseibium sp. HPY-6 TaxID=3229852 RepID=UPI00338F0E99